VENQTQFKYIHIKLCCDNNNVGFECLNPHPFGSMICAYKNVFSIYKPSSASLIGPTKSNPHFINGYFSKVVISLTKLCVVKLPTLWHAS